jgi:N-acyl-L-homoserine lactone synthetase
MATIMIGSRTELPSRTIRLMHAFRHDVFVRRLAWSLPMIDGVESDQYDRGDATYFVASDDGGQVTACTRLLPTTAPYMLPELFPHLLGSMTAPCDPGTWELSRFAASVQRGSNERLLALSQSAIDLLDSVLHFARRNAVTRLMLVTSLSVERLMIRAGLRAHRISKPEMVEASLCVALFIDVARCDADVKSAHCASSASRRVRGAQDIYDSDGREIRRA